jgi:chaperone required for assembly of F1-ATPase
MAKKQKDPGKRKRERYAQQREGKKPKTPAGNGTFLPKHQVDRFLAFR